MTGLRFRPRMEPLDRRDVPSTVVADHIPFNLSGVGGTDSATGTVTVILQDDGTYHWDYFLHNNSFVYGDNNFWGIGRFEVPVGNAAWATNVGSSLGATATSGVSGDSSGGTIWWQFSDEMHPGLTTGQDADFWFNTPAMPIGSAGVDALSYDVGADTSGPALAPVVTNSATLDFSNSTTGKAYQIAVYIKSGDTELVNTTINVTANANATTIRDAVEAACAQAGLYVKASGASQLTIGGKPNLPVTLIALDSGQTVNGRFQVDKTINGATLLQWTGTVAVKVNGTQLNP